MIEGALPGVRVVEWGNFISAPFCGKVLTELGADVIKLEAPISGDDSRRHGPYPGGVADQERSGLFLLANINKRGSASTSDLRKDGNSWTGCWKGPTSSC